MSDYRGKQELQYLLFPDGLLYNRKDDRCRTERVNEVFSCIARQQRFLAGEGQQEEGVESESSYRVARIEMESPTFSAGLGMDSALQA